MRRTRRLAALITTLVVAATTTLVWAGPAHAGSGYVDRWAGDYLTVTNAIISVYDDTTEWGMSFSTNSRLPAGQCVHLRIDVDRALADDPKYPSHSLCGPDDGPMGFSGSVTRSRTRGATLPAVYPSGTVDIIKVWE